MTAVTYDQIATDWGATVATVRRWMCEDKVPRRNAGRQKAVERDEYEAWCLRRFGRLPPPDDASRRPVDLGKLRTEAHQLIGLAASLTARANALLESLPGPET